MYCPYVTVIEYRITGKYSSGSFFFFFYSKENSSVITWHVFINVVILSDTRTTKLNPHCTSRGIFPKKILLSIRQIWSQTNSVTRRTMKSRIWSTGAQSWIGLLWQEKSGFHRETGYLLILCELWEAKGRTWKAPGSFMIEFIQIVFVMKMF